MWLDRAVLDSTLSGPARPTELPLSRRSVAWKVNAEPAVLAGGGRALLLQVAHPAVGAGVEQHSSYASDPWGRLFRTVDVMMKLSFGEPDVSRRQQRLLDKMHRRVSGTTDDGTRYHAHDADLQLWVWATLVDTALMVYEKVRPPLGLDERERFYAESTLVARGCGVPDGVCPPDWSSFRAYVDRVVREDLRVTDAARKVAVATMSPPLPGPLSPAAAGINQLLTVGLLPPSVRDQYGYRWGVRQQRRLDALLLAGRTAATVTPGALRHAPTEWSVRRSGPLRLPWLQLRGAALTAEAMRAAGYAE